MTNLRWAIYYAGVDCPLAEYASTEQEALALASTLPQAQVYDRHDGKDEHLRTSTDRSQGSTFLRIWDRCGTPAGRLAELVHLLDQVHPVVLRPAVAPAPAATAQAAADFLSFLTGASITVTAASEAAAPATPAQEEAHG